jgi:hypothetical protein
MKPPTNKLPLLLLCAILAVMTALLWGPMRDETATVDETTYMGGGYAYFKTGSCRMGEENPLLVQMILAAPMLAFDVHVSDQAQALMHGRAVSPLGWRWNVTFAPVQQLFPDGVNWYHDSVPEAQYFGKILVYDPANDAERLLFWARFTQLLMTLGTTVFVFFWAGQLTGNPWAGLMAAVLWAFNPVTLAYGHLAITEPGISLTYAVAIWWFTRTVASPRPRNAFILGVLTALALQMKLLALILLPTYVALLALLWLRERKIAPVKQLAALAGLFLAGGWIATMAVYFPHCGPPPPVDFGQALELRVPDWFTSLRPLLMPGEFAKAVTLKLLHSQSGQDAFLMGQWSKMGWWYYYPVVMWFKTPVPLLLLTAAGAVLLLWRVRTVPYAALVPWAAAALYLLSALTSKIDIGVRHAMPVYPLLAVGVVDQLARLDRKWRIVAWAGGAWLVAIALFAYPDYLPYCNVFAGGTANGYQNVIDSNYDWGQDGKRLKQWMADNHVDHIYLDFFGTQTAIEWHKIPNTRVDAQSAQQISEGDLVVSISELMRPEWAWLRASRSPTARIGYTLFVYHFP